VGAPPSVTRRVILVFHRYAGLAMALFLVDIALTGSVMAFGPQLDRWLNRDLLTVPADGAPLLDPLALRDLAEALAPHGHADVVPLEQEAGAAFPVGLSPRTDPATGKPYALDATELLLDPRTGALRGGRTPGRIALDRRTLVSMCFRLHYSLGITNDGVAKWLFGLVAAAWTVDCFAAFFLTLPARRRGPPAGELTPGRLRGFLRRWRPAWVVKFGAGFHRVNFDLHRALSLWTWAMLFVFAWTGVGFMLGEEVYQPVMRAAFDMRSPAQEAFDRLAKLDPPLETPALGWEAARDMGRRLTREAAARAGAAMGQEKTLVLDREHGLYQFAADWAKGDEREMGQVFFDARDGALRIELPPAFAAPRETFGVRLSTLLFQLHMGSIGGLPMKAFVAFMGLLITLVTASGVLIWWKKRAGRLRAGALRAVTVARASAP
jgi:uncharacterized iron-regulated membrane protein